jgi:membrane fusion protein (multidrug efflux system)
MRIATRLTAFVAAVFLVAACGGAADDIESKRKKIDELKTQKAEIEAQIAQLEKETGPDTNVVDKRTEVSVISLQKGTFVNLAEFQGTVISEENINLGSEMGGRIIKVNVKEGQKVSKGQVLANFDSEILQKNLEEVENALELANTTFERQKSLWDQKIGSEIQYLQAKNQKESLEKKIASIRSQMSKASLRSPINGTIDKIFMNAGEMAGAGVPVLRVVNNDMVKINADVPERFVGKIKNGDSVGIKLSVIDKEIRGKVRSVGQVIDVANRTFTLIVDPVGKQERDFLKPNMLAVVKAVVYRKKDAVSVPTDLIRFEGVDKFVYTVVDNKAQKIKVETGESFNAYTEILSGLNGGEQLISKGLNSVSDGAEVNIIAKP